MEIKLKALGQSLHARISSVSIVVCNIEKSNVQEIEKPHKSPGTDIVEPKEIWFLLIFFDFKPHEELI